MTKKGPTSVASKKGGVGTKKGSQASSPSRSPARSPKGGKNSPGRKSEVSFNAKVTTDMGQTGMGETGMTDKALKYILVPDKYSMGDVNLLDQESRGRNNTENLSFFLLLMTVIMLSAAMCMYLTYSFTESLARAVFIMLIFGTLWDLLFFRMLIIFITTMYLFVKGRKIGYRKMEYNERENNMRE
jgi:hypothetical protein